MSKISRKAWDNHRADEELFDGSELKRIGDIVNRDKPVEVRCKVAGHLDKRSINNLIKCGAYCKTCAYERRCNEIAVEWIASLKEEGCTPLFTAEDYRRKDGKQPNQVPRDVICPSGNRWTVTRANWTHKTKPLRCSCKTCKADRGGLVKRSNKKLTQEEAARRCEERGAELLSEYKGARRHITVRWVDCEHEDTYVASGIFRGKAKCSRCSGNWKRSFEEVAQEIEEAAKGYRLVEGQVYKNRDQKLEIICPERHVFLTSRRHFITLDSRCPECARLVRSGAGSHFYDHTMDDEERMLLELSRKSPQYREFRRQALERDRHACTCCGSDEELNVHHLYAFKTYEELRFEPANGITLCKAHHVQYHADNASKLGEDTREDFIEWLSQQDEEYAELIEELKARDLS